MIYLDYAAATPVDEKVLAAILPYFRDDFYNPSAAYGPARDARTAYEDARHRVASLIGARPAEIIITAGATESINLALGGFGGGLVTTAIEHPAVLAMAELDQGSTILPVDKSGRLGTDDLKKAITDDTEIISVGYANNEIGTVQPIKEIAEIVADARADRAERGVKAPLLFHTDASQAAGLLDINVARLGVDLMTLNAGKCYGPKQVGCLYVRAGVELYPLIVGGGQEMGLRSGTENVAGAIGFARALEIAEKKRKSEVKRLGIAGSGLIDFITKKWPEAIMNGSKKHRLPNILNFSLPGLDGERLVYALDQRGVYVATGSACAANKGTRSHVLAAIGLDDATADGSIRISMGRNTTPDEIEQFKKILVEAVECERKIS